MSVHDDRVGFAKETSDRLYDEEYVRKSAAIAKEARVGKGKARKLRGFGTTLLEEKRKKDTTFAPAKAKKGRVRRDKVTGHIKCGKPLCKPATPPRMHEMQEKEKAAIKKAREDAREKFKAAQETKDKGAIEVAQQELDKAEKVHQAHRRKKKFNKQQRIDKGKRIRDDIDGADRVVWEAPKVLAERAIAKTYKLAKQIEAAGPTGQLV